MDSNGVSLNGDDKNPQDSVSSNCNETRDEGKLLLSNHSKMTDDGSGDGADLECLSDQNSVHVDNNADLNMVGTTTNSIIGTECDESSGMAGPIAKKYKKSSDDASDIVEISDITEPGCSTSILVSKYFPKSNNRHYRKKSDDSDEDVGDDENEADEMGENSKNLDRNSIDQLDSSPDPEPEIIRSSSIDNEESTQSDRDDQDEQQSNSSGKADNSSEWSTASEDELDGGIPAVLKKNKPTPKWFIVPEVINRQIGNNKHIDRNFYGSLHVVQRMKLLHKMDAHEGCVNALCFNESGRFLASASDDLKVIVWDWAKNKDKNIFTSGHRLNIFDVKWLPIDFESLIVTCARDGYVRVIDTRTSTNRRLTSHRKEARRLAVHPDHVYGILSVGDDGKVLSIDIRAEKPTRLLTVKDRSSHIPLYTVHINPRNSNEFCVGGRSRSIKIYDRRRILEPVQTLCPHNLRQNSSAYVTSAVYNYNGTELLASYSDDDIYLFDTAVPHPCGDYAHHYEGHRNSVTVKGVNFFGPKSEFIVSGSDCSNIFIWEKNTEAIVQWLLGDNNGVVNRLESHPHAPILATSGLDSDVKIWVPSNRTDPTMPNLESCIKTNMSNRVADGLRPDVFDSRMLSVFFHHVRQYGLFRGQPGMQDRILQNHHYDDISESSNESASSNNNNGDDSSLDDETEVPQCSPS